MIKIGVINDEAVFNLSDCCSNAEKDGKDGFVGIRFENNKPCVVFPRGYRYTKDNNDELRKEVMSMLHVLDMHNRERDKSVDGGLTDSDQTEFFPVYAYQYIIFDFLIYGYYMERENIFRKNGTGKISWKRTIQQVKPVIDDDNCVYLDYITRRTVAIDTIITRIHEHCVYESFTKLGWIFVENSFSPRKPQIPFSKSFFLSILEDALKSTFNDRKKKLFSSMISIIRFMAENENGKKTVYGIEKFEAVWEWMIDKRFGVYEKIPKDEYYPHGVYHMIDKSKNGIVHSSLEPDTIMRLDEGKYSGIYILDAKYYRYGVGKTDQYGLPASDSIHKQFTYAEYVKNNDKLCKNEMGKLKIHNAFILPYDSGEQEGKGILGKIKLAGAAYGEWIPYSEWNPEEEPYKRILVLLVDTKYLMETFLEADKKTEIEKMAQYIKSRVVKSKSDDENEIVLEEERERLTQFGMIS